MLSTTLKSGFHLMLRNYMRTPSQSFKFVRDEQGHCIMYYRNYSHMKWEGPQQLLKVHACYTVLLLKLMLIFKVIKKKLINSKPLETFHYISLLLPLGKQKFGIQGEISNFNFQNKMSKKCSLRHFSLWSFQVHTN